MAAMMSLIQSAPLNGHDPYIYLKVFSRAFRRSGRVTSTSCWRITGSPLELDKT